jgi:YhcH/YjgK/YiaL family protein
VILGHISNLAKDKLALAPILQKGLQYLQSTDFLSMAPGCYEVDGDNMFALVQSNKPEPRAQRKAETHAKYIDVQYLVQGAEIIGYSDIKYGAEVLENLLAQKDAIFYKTVINESELVLTQGMYGIFFPWDIHRPSCLLDRYSEVKKVVLKIKLSELER